MGMDEHTNDTNTNQPVEGDTGQQAQSAAPNVITPDTETSLQSSTPTTPNPTPTPAPRNKLLLIIIAVVVVVLIAVGAAWMLMSKDKKDTSTTDSTPVRIGLSLDNLLQTRWATDRDDMTKYAKEHNAFVTTLVANSNDQTQVSQINNLVAQKVDVLIVVAHSSEAVAPAIAKARAAGIKVIAYDRMITGTQIDYYASYDSTKVGELEAKHVMAAVPKTVTKANIAIIDGSPTDNNATLVHNGIMSVVQPLVSAGKAQVVYSEYTPNWDPDTAYSNVKNLLDAKTHLDAIICANDGMANGVAQALNQANMLGKVPFSGQDADQAAVQRLVAGTQTVTVYKPLNDEAKYAVMAALAFSGKQKPLTNASVDNGKAKIPSFLLTPTAVTKDNVKTTVIKDGFLSSEAVYGSSGAK
jgi:D-xylose transport system substrate-binding protein